MQEQRVMTSAEGEGSAQRSTGLDSSTETPRDDNERTEVSESRKTQRRTGGGNAGSAARGALLAHWDFPLVKGWMVPWLQPPKQGVGWGTGDGEAKAVLQENMRSRFGNEPCASTFLSPSLLPLTGDLGV